MVDKIINLNDDNFKENISQISKLLLVDFWAEWCGPCKMIAPIIMEIADEFYGELIIAKLNIDENPLTPSQYNICSIPTLLLFRNGEVVATKIGALSKGQIKDFINVNL